VRTELHFHLLPEVDDGPADTAAALGLARLAVEDGTTTVVATPHARCLYVAEIAPRVAILTTALGRAGIPLAVRSGAELTAEDALRLTPTELACVAQGPAGRRWLLLEAPFSGELRALPDAFARLGGIGYGVLLAHPERCACLAGPGGAVHAALRAGARLQISASSLAGLHGPAARARAFSLLSRGCVEVVASDAHGVDRPPLLSEAVALLAGRGWTWAQAEQLVQVRPRALLEGGLPAVGRLAAATAARAAA
jgi:protein-tyrosine phosphatase